MSASAPAGLGVPTRTLVAVFVTMALLFATVQVLARWYGAERRTRARDFYARGQQLANNGRDEQAIREFRNALSIDRTSGVYRLAMARSLIRLNRFVEASIYLQELLRSDPADAIPNLLLARIASRQGRTEAAIDYYNRAIFGFWRDKPEQNRLEARWELIGLLEKSGTRKQILAQLLEISDQAPNDPELKKKVALRLLGNHSPNPAAELFRDLLRQSPRDADALAGYGLAQFAMGNYITAQTYLRRSLRERPDQAEPRRILDLTNEILALDLTLRGLGVQERLRRSRLLLERSLAVLETCLAKPGTPTPPKAATLVENARKRLAVRRQRSADAAEENLAMAEDLWSERAGLCGATDASEPALERLMANISR